MTDREKNEVATFRYGIISPVLHSTRQDQKGYFTEMSKKSFDVPYLGRRQYKWPTFKHWLKVYRKSGIDGLRPVERKDKGKTRKIDADLGEAIKEAKEESPYLSCSNLYRLLLIEERLPHPPISEGTLRKFLKDNGLDKREKPVARKKYEAALVNELWVSDFMHGPRNLFGKGSRVYLCAIIDDHSRVIVGGKFFDRENTPVLVELFKAAALTYGLPNKFYCDNGAPFSSHGFLWSCAKLEVALIHSKPYDSPSRGKIERFNRTVRQKFLNPLPLHQIKSLDHLNELFSEWLGKEYNRHYHTGIGGKPLDRYMAGIKKVRIRTITVRELDLCFYQTLTRKVKNDSTISIKGKLYELPSGTIGKKVEIRFPGDDPSNLTFYENNQPVCSIKPVDVHKNARNYIGIRYSNTTKMEENQ